MNSCSAKLLIGADNIGIIPFTAFMFSEDYNRLIDMLRLLKLPLAHTLGADM